MCRAVYLGVLALCCGCAANAQTVLSGRVVDDSGVPLDNVRVAISQDGGTPLETFTNPTGAFKASLPSGGIYEVMAEHRGFFRLVEREVRVEESGAEITLVLNPQREIFQSVDVGAEPSRIDPAQTSSENELS